MEEMKNMTAERSLEIITEQIAQSRKAVSKSTGQSLYVSGLCTMAMAVVVAIVNIISARNGGSAFGHFLWFLLPVIIWLDLRNIKKEQAKAPVSFVSSLVGKTWLTFAALVLGFFILGNVWNYILSHSTTNTTAIIAHHVDFSPIIILLMGMAVTITGHILKSKWLVWFGIIASLVIAIGDYACVGLTILARCGAPLWLVSHAEVLLPCVSVFVFALFGLLLPGWMLKKQK